ncbi:pilus assembly protein N-terminal domain-containing protein [Nitratireductor kimnyeongensis]|uniref:Pilus assembly protein N-terminal domain-containing protein n=1 Tax=Nitratireductor kimnyeongensis TaxID=430679 RepID=A0ABW0T846_9HYPH|nr:pilus assembly protein N-terminal domain-containing protein [Nitratireductor kimnyeongensis]QZZ34118.1 pilus assembly protein N-terminal domain-containing protein [Nitratireductor kimnyeongensis]
MRAVYSKTGTALKTVFLTAGLVALSGITSANEAAIEVVMNQAKIVKLAREADTIVIGNPEIADAAVQDATTIVLTGKGFGVTNLVVLDIDGQPIVDEQVMVSRQSASSVRIYRRANVQTLSCTPYCESSYKTDAERASEAEISANQ